LLCTNLTAASIKGEYRMITLILVNGAVYTMDGTICEAVAVSGDRIFKVGTTAEIKVLATTRTTVIDLKGKTVLPGFIDSHAHLVGYGASLHSLDLSSAGSVEDIIGECRRFIDRNDIKQEEWVLGRGWNQNRFSGEKVNPTRKDLDRVGRNNPLLLLRACGHVGVANTIALKAVNVSRATLIGGGDFGKDESGELNGVITEAALEWFKKNRPGKPGIPWIRRATLDGGSELLKYGITSVHSEDSYDLGYSGDFPDICKTYKRMAEAGELPVRVYQKISLPGEQDIKSFLAGDLRTGDGDEYYKIGPMKQWCDGTIGAKTAALLAPYSDDPGNNGVFVYSREELCQNVMTAHRGNMQVALHAIGDGALAMIVDVYEEVLQKYPRKARHRIIHCQTGNLALYKRLARMDVSIDIQPPQTASDWSMMNGRLGTEREKESHNWRTLTDLGVCIAAGSDIPVDAPDVFYGIYAVVTRQDASGEPGGGWLPEQKVTVEEAIKMYTINAARAAFEEDIKGTVTAGKLADMVVVDNNPFEVQPIDLKDIKVEQVILGGKLKLPG
jgi:predicted amidohydrolase YtcJ